MAFTLNGFGTKHYGKRQLPDGTYVTTKWIVLAFVPIVPLASFQVTAIGPSEWGPGLGIIHSRSMRMREVALDGRQVAVTYAVAAVIVGLIAFAIVSSN